MRKNMIKLMVIMLLMAVMISGCGNNNSKVDQVLQNQTQAVNEKEKQNQNAVATEEGSAYVSEPDSRVDVDLTALSSTMVYSEVYDMLTIPEHYIGKTVKMSGMFAVYSTENQIYPAVIIADATACCSQGLEFLLEGNPTYPEGYPKPETDITVIGTFETYDEDGSVYCRLKDAKLQK